MENFNNIPSTIKEDWTFKEDEQLYKAIYLNSPICIAFSSPIGKVIKVNQKFCNLLGYTEEELVGKSFADFTPPEIMIEEVQLVREAISSGKDFYRNEKSFIHKKGHLIWIDVSMTVMRDEENNVKYLVAMLVDITEKIKMSKDLELSQKQLENKNKELEEKVSFRTKELNLKNEKLEISNKELKAFAYAVSHDLKEPVRTIGNFADLLVKKYRSVIDASGKDYLDFIIGCTNRMEVLISGILEYSTLEKKEKKIIDVNIIVKNKVKDLDQLIKEKNATIEIENLPKNVLCMDSHIGIVFYNFLNNALKFNKNPRPLIEVYSIEENNQWKFFVKDNGIGIEKEYKNKIFGLFKRLNNRNDYEGSGIGLSLCEKIVNQHGGEIWVESDYGKGAIFGFSLPKL